ncbi:hypothetical protein [Xanthovirga aplysinae]|uniref:hypothetical protein n=1 Tax=Xanthovirga aplysinae TaxID=2529853 RepID=UPI0012BCA57E|nr:hypothetical protein [Xanthovirga aplysinae]MTI29851.1 hypothetical protein [Xanthovirga aplysinae]
MNSRISYSETGNELRVEIIPKPKGILKFGMLFFYILPFLIFIALGIILLTRKDFEMETYYILLGLILGSLILIIIFLKKIYEKEIIVVDKIHLTLFKRFIFDTNK